MARPDEDDQAYSKTLALMTRYEPRLIVFPEWLPSEPNGTVLARASCHVLRLRRQPHPAPSPMRSNVEPNR